MLSPILLFRRLSKTPTSFRNGNKRKLEKLNIYKLDIFKVSIAASAVTALIILSFRQYFFYIPFQNGFDAISTFGFLALLGWISLVVVPPIVLSGAEKWTTRRHVIFLISVLMWTGSTLAIKIYTLSTVGQIWADYLVAYPALFFVEWLLPGYYVFLAVTLRKTFIKSANKVAETKPVV